MPDNRSSMRKTIVARIATFDSSIPNPTAEQVAETLRLLDAAIQKHDGTPDGETLKKMKAKLETSGGGKKKTREFPESFYAK